MTKESIVEWASSWVTDQPPGQRARFAEALAAELKGWRAPEDTQLLQGIHDLAAARLRNGPLEPNVEHDLKVIVRLAEALT